MSDFLQKLGFGGKQYTEIEPKGTYFDPDKTSSGVEDVDVGYKPTNSGLAFLNINTTSDAYKYLDKRYKDLIKKQEQENRKRGSVPNFPNDSFEYWMQQRRLTKVVENILGRQHQLTREGKELLVELQEYNKKMQFDQVDNGQAGRIREVKALEILSNATKIAFLKQAPINLREDMNNFERDYWDKTPEY